MGRRVSVSYPTLFGVAAACFLVFCLILTALNHVANVVDEVPQLESHYRKLEEKVAMHMQYEQQIIRNQELSLKQFIHSPIRKLNLLTDAQQPQQQDNTQINEITQSNSTLQVIASSPVVSSDASNADWCLSESKCISVNPVCDSKWNTSNPADLYTIESRVVNENSNSPTLSVCIRLRSDIECCESQGLSSFRVTVRGDQYLAAADPELILEKPFRALHKSVELFNLPRPQKIFVQGVLTLFGISRQHFDAELLEQSRDYNNWSEGRYVGKRVPFVNKEATSDNVIVYKFEADNEKAVEIPSTKNESKPLCFSKSNWLQGAWVRNSEDVHEAVGYERANTTGWGNKKSATGAYGWSFEPSTCELDRTVSMHEELTRLGWMAFAGDSNIRIQFYIMCETLNGQFIDEKNSTYKWNDCPQACVGPDLDKDGEADWVATYHSWFPFKTYYWNEKMIANTFYDLCKIYSPSDIPSSYGWPAPTCDKIPSHLKNHKGGPSLLYLAWGSHTSHHSGSSDFVPTFNSLSQHDNFAYTFSNIPTILPFVTACSPNLIPTKFGTQALIRNNERVYRLNKKLEEMFTPLLPKQDTEWSSFLDLFHLSHASVEDFGTDAVHQAHAIYEQSMQFLFHMIRHNPKYNQRRIEKPAVQVI